MRSLLKCGPTVFGTQNNSATFHARILGDSIVKIAVLEHPEIRRSERSAYRSKGQTVVRNRYECHLITLVYAVVVHHYLVTGWIDVNIGRCDMILAWRLIHVQNAGSIYVPRTTKIIGIGKANEIAAVVSKVQIIFA
jgi:hypothetical protein